ncbi:MAG: hypothetical protein HQK79_07820 [Desulfobacterales bacterium]|nr:hypothetical protein [Desulfobacterales bacterium]MBF0396724.1 hypothetical protein [Desulfobacterales bacterium]
MYKIFFILSPALSYANDLYYVRLDLKTINGIMSETNLTMSQAYEEFRIEKFNTIKVKGIADSSSNIDLISTAKHNAISNLLIKFGLISVKSKNNYYLSVFAYDEIIVSYEGLISLPLNILNHGYTKDNKNYEIELEVIFSPIAFPDEWRYLYLKDKISRTINDLLSVFK